ncbi:hypothetical protein BGZ74_004949 [Mortierella antarctica]|nr:hypothetical protein BGZ74_004949 [Mortierella antarctica]
MNKNGQVNHLRHGRPRHRRRLCSRLPSGVLADSEGRVQALWLSYLGHHGKCSGSDTEYHLSLAISTILPVLRPLQQGLYPQLRSLNIELTPVLMSKARDMGLSDAWVKRVEAANPARHQVYKGAPHRDWLPLVGDPEGAGPDPEHQWQGHHADPGAGRAVRGRVARDGGAAEQGRADADGADRARGRERDEPSGDVGGRDYACAAQGGAAAEQAGAEPDVYQLKNEWEPFVHVRDVADEVGDAYQWHADARSG